jgi:hypothetical protein
MDCFYRFFVVDVISRLASALLTFAEPTLAREFALIALPELRNSGVSIGARLSQHEVRIS